MVRTMTVLLVALALALTACGNKDEVKKVEGKKAEAKKADPSREPVEDPSKLEERSRATVDSKPEEPKEADPSREPVEDPSKLEERSRATVDSKPEEPKAEEPKALTGKPSIEDRRKRVQEIYRLGRSNSAEDLEKLKVVILDEALPGYERATAIRALGTKPRAELVDTLKELMESKDLAISSEAAIMLFQWGEKDIATQKLKELQKMGIALRRAFFKGLKDGNYEYAPEAEEFFAAALDAPQAHVRLDAALGLLHLGQTDKALEHFKKAMSTEEKSYVRLTAVSYLASARKVPEVKALLEEAAKDADPKVAARAKQILSAGKRPPVQPAETKPEAAPKATDEKPATP